MRSKPFLRTVSLVLVALVGVLTTGVPSHHHGEVGPTPALEDAGHHGHVVQLIDQSDRLKSEGTSTAALPPSSPIGLAFVPADVAEGTSASTSRAVAGGRSPPTAQPRAPPVSI
jgi:hypothetical protein